MAVYADGWTYCESNSASEEHHIVPSGEPVAEPSHEERGLYLFHEGTDSAFDYFTVGVVCVSIGDNLAVARLR